MSSGDPREKAVPPFWAGPLSLWCVRLAAAGRSRETIGLRRAHVAQLARGVGGSPATLTAGELLAWLAGREWRRETRRAVRSSLRGFLAHVGRDDLVTELPFAPAEIPVPRPTPDDVVDAALAAADDRQLVILRLASEAGLRRGEISRVHVDDLSRDLLGWTLLVHGKGGKRRWVPLSDDLATMVRLWCSGGWLLPGRIDGHLSARRVGELASEVLPGVWTTHSLRHRFATRAHNRTGDLVAVSRLLGHASVATTQRYVATDAARLRAVAAAAA